MPQENGWATGPEHCDEDGRVCPYCGSENTDSGSLDTQAGQVVESDCQCLDCGKTWGNLYNIAGWYDDKDDLHEDTRSIDDREHMKLLRESLAGLCDSQLTSRDREDAIVRGLAALEETKEIEE